uniref:Conserved oligomeric Golgi complex subunit 1 n=1 Tax=Ditylenchus dipsaci TaxID=166011 RepID=A0A915EHJ2_9BILA
MLDVPRLMQDLTVEQLVQIQSSFDQEIENKKEELRQMVGRRYRDVLEASNTVKRLTEIANDLVVELADVGKASAIASTEKSKDIIKNSKTSNHWTHYFVLLNSLLPQIGATNDSLGDVFCLLLAENFHRQFASQASKTVEGGLSKLLFNRLLTARLELMDNLVNQLGHQTDWQVVAGQLAALALLKQLEADALLEAYLQARMDTIFLNLKSSSTSLIGIIRMMKATTQVVDDVFMQGEAILSVLKTITQPGWCPESVSMLWVEKMCSMAIDRVRALCDHFEQTQEVVEFVAAINQIFKSDWPSIASNLSIYQRLFGNSLSDRFHVLIHKELSLLENGLLVQLPQVNSNPMPLFQKRAVKFDALLASGVSHELNDLVQKMFDGMRQLLSNVNKYVSLSKEQEESDQKSNSHDALADAVIALVDRLLAHFEIQLNGSVQQQPRLSSTPDNH